MREENDKLIIVLAGVFFDTFVVYSRIFRGGTKESLEYKNHSALETEVWTRNMFWLQPAPQSPCATLPLMPSQGSEPDHINQTRGLFFIYISLVPL